MHRCLHDDEVLFEDATLYSANKRPTRFELREGLIIQSAGISERAAFSRSARCWGRGQKIIDPVLGRLVNRFSGTGPLQH